MRYVIGIEGGGTKSLMRLSDISGNTIAESSGGSLNVFVIDKDNVILNLKEMYTEIIKTIGFIPDISSVCIGTAGMLGDAIKEFYIDTLKDICNCNNVVAFTDAHIALYGHLGNLPGISITSGTGSICIGKNIENNVVTCGGWGHIFSDEGSAYDITVNALKYIYGSIDKSNDKTILCSEFLKATKSNNVNELLSFIYSKETDKTKLASLSEIVNDCAEKGDYIAKMVLDNAADKLFNICVTVSNNLGFKSMIEFYVVFNGSVLNKSDFVKEGLTERLYKTYKGCKVIAQLNDAVSGAVYIASHL